VSTLPSQPATKLWRGPHLLYLELKLARLQLRKSVDSCRKGVQIIPALISPPINPLLRYVASLRAFLAGNAPLSGLLFFIALALPFGIAVHIGAEYLALGGHVDLIAFLERHAYLVVMEGFTLGIIAQALQRRSPFARRLLLQNMVMKLPFSGNSPQFFALSLVWQLAFYIITQCAEGAPLRGEDFLIGLLIAAIAASFTSMLLALVPRRLLALIRLAIQSFTLLALPSARQRKNRRTRILITARLSGFRTVIGSRPPPAFSFIGA
jgi:hypothetical protein